MWLQAGTADCLNRTSVIGEDDRSAKVPGNMTDTELSRLLQGAAKHKVLRFTDVRGAFGGFQKSGSLERCAWGWASRVRAERFRTV